MITIKTFVFNPFQVNTYVVWDESGCSTIIDPACCTFEEFESLKSYIAGQKLTPTGIVLTHGHADHLLGLERISQWYGLQPIIHRDEVAYAQTAAQQAMLFGLPYEAFTGEWQLVEEGEKVMLGQTEAEIFTLSGHSPAGMAIYSRSDHCIFTGDALFKGSIGRTDLPGGDYDTLISHIREKLLTLPPDTMVFPGHGPHTTIAHEMKYNPFIASL
ncbi:MAG: MBL fold metallo-hydrolase [Bacteroidales bacterium]